MNQAFFEHAKKVLDELTDEQMWEALTKAGIDCSIRQFPEPEEVDEEDDDDSEEHF